MWASSTIPFLTPCNSVRGWELKVRQCQVYRADSDTNVPSPPPGGSNNMRISTDCETSISDCPSPTVSNKTTGYPAALKVVTTSSVSRKTLYDKTKWTDKESHVYSKGILTGCQTSQNTCIARWSDIRSIGTTQLIHPCLISKYTTTRNLRSWVNTNSCKL